MNNRKYGIPSFWDCGPIQPSSSSTVSSETVPPQQRMRSIVDGIISPFRVCVQPPLDPTTPQQRWDPSIQRTFSEGSSQQPFSLQSHSSGASVDDSIIRENDILCGRGGNNNKHIGNTRFRQLIAANRPQYVGLTKKQKMLMARQIVSVVHYAGGRFLARDVHTGRFINVGLSRSLEKTSQALREKQAADQYHHKPPAKSKNVEAPTLIIPTKLQSIYRIPPPTPPTRPLPPTFGVTPSAYSPFPPSSRPYLPPVTPADQPPHIPAISDQPPRIPAVERAPEWRCPLSLEDRVVGPPSSSHLLPSPSSSLQSRRHSRMDGLSALSAAAFLRLDDEA